MRSYQCDEKIVSRILARLAVGAALAAVLSLNYAFADTIPGVLCTETAAGCMAPPITITLLSGTVMTLTVGSDGEVGVFDPFGYGANTSDGIVFSFNAADTTVTNQSPMWTNMLANGTGQIPHGSGPAYVLPGDPAVEQVGSFLLSQKLAAGFQGTTRFYYICETGGASPGGTCAATTSDVVTVGNDAQTGNGLVTFSSDSEAPEPSTLALMLTALGLAAYFGRRRLARVPKTEV